MKDLVFSQPRRLRRLSEADCRVEQGVQPCIEGTLYGTVILSDARDRGPQRSRFWIAGVGGSAATKRESKPGSPEIPTLDFWGGKDPEKNPVIIATSGSPHETV